MGGLSFLRTEYRVLISKLSSRDEGERMASFPTRRIFAINQNQLQEVTMYQPNKSGPSIRTILIILVACLLASIQQGIGQAVLPLKPNQLVMTCFSGTSNNAVIPDPDNYVIGFMDTRDPLGDGATLGSNWVPPVGWAFHNETSTDEWTAANLGEVFGVTLD